MTEMVNIPLLRKAVEWAEAEAAKPRERCEWVQSYYVVPQTIDDPILGRPGRVGTGSDWVSAVRSQKATDCGTCYCIAGYVASLTDATWDYTTARDVAAEALGVGYTAASDLFHGRNTIEDVRRIAERIAGEQL